MRRILAALRRTAQDPSPLVQVAVNNGCSFESCPERWEGQRWHGWNLCPTHYAETAQRTEPAVII